MTKRNTWRTLVVVLLLAVVGAGVFWWSRSNGGPAAKASGPGGAPPVTVSRPLRKEIIEWDEFTGQFSAVQYVEMRARVSGYLQEIHFADGQLVQAGDLLFVIDPRPFQTTLDTSRAQAQQAQARLDLANRQLARAGELRQRDFVAQTTYDERLEEVRGATAALDSARATIRRAELDLEFTRVTAPISGRIGRQLVNAGNLVTADQTMLATIVSLDPIYFEFDMSEAQYLAYQRAENDGRMRSQRDGVISVFVRLADEREWSRRGQMDFLDNRIDRGAGTIRARAIFANPDALIAPGQFGRLRLPGSELYAALLLPDAAIVTDQSRKLVMTVAPDGTVVPKPIRPGPIHDGLRIVREGLAAEDTVVINGLMRARPGAKVTPQPGRIEPRGN